MVFILLHRFLRYDMSLELIKYIKEIDAKKERDHTMSKHLIEEATPKTNSHY